MSSLPDYAAPDRHIAGWGNVFVIIRTYLSIFNCLFVGRVAGQVHGMRHLTRSSND